MTQYDEYLRPINSPYSQNTAQVDAFSFNAGNDRGIITNPFIQNASISNAKIGTAAIGTANIGTLTFNEIAGGTAILGGTANGNGVLVVKDSGGTTRVTLDNSGVTVTNGKISVQNTAGGTAIDSLGIVSNSNNFIQSATSNSSLNQAISGTAETDITGASLTFSLTRSALVFAIFNVGVFLTQSVGNTANFTVRLKVDSGEVSRVVHVNIPTSDPSTRSSSNFVVSLLSSGSHTIKLTGQQETVVGAPTSTIHIMYLTYIILGT